MAVADGEIEEGGLRYERYVRDADVEAYAALLKQTHDAVRRGEPEGAPAGEDDGVYPARRGKRVEQHALARGGAAAAHVEPGPHAVGAEADRASRPGRRIFDLPYPDGAYIIYGYFLHMLHALFPASRPAFSFIQSSTSASRKPESSAFISV